MSNNVFNLDALALNREKAASKVGSAWDATALKRLPDTKVIALVSRIEAAIPDKKRRAIAVLSSRHGEGVSTVLGNLARVIGQNSRSRVAYVDARSVQRDQRLVKLSRLETSPQGFTASSNWIYSPLDQGLGGITLLKDLVEKLLHTNHDIVLVEASPVLDDPAGSVVTRAVSGTILVVQAEQTRLPVIAEAKRRIQEAGGQIIGTVLNKRRIYIPKAVYRYL